MKILQCHNFYRPVGGADTVFFQTIDLLQRAGHEVAPFAGRHPDNYPTPYSRYFVSEADFRRLNIRSPFQAAGHALRMIYSFEARRKLGTLLSKFRPDIAHAHNIYHELSPSIFPLLRSEGIPAVMTAHDRKLVCPNYRMYLRGKICDDCVDGKLYRAISRRCVADSAAASAVCVVEGYIHRILGLYDRYLNAIICPSLYLLGELKRAGYKTELIHIPNSVPAPDTPPKVGPGEYVLFFGVLLIQKGPQVLLEAARQVPDIPIKIAGRGVIEPDLRAKIDEYGLKNVSLLGFQPPDQIPGLLAGCRFTVIPSTGTENCPMSVLESFAAARPVIGSDLGGIPELIEDGVLGYLVPHSDPDALADRMRKLWDNPDLALEMGRRCFERVKAEYSPEKYLERLLQAYDFAIRDMAGGKRERAKTRSEG